MPRANLGIRRATQNIQARYSGPTPRLRTGSSLVFLKPIDHVMAMSRPIPLRGFVSSYYSNVLNNRYSYFRKIHSFVFSINKADLPLVHDRGSKSMIIENKKGDLRRISTEFEGWDICHRGLPAVDLSNPGFLSKTPG